VLHSGNETNETRFFEFKWKENVKRGEWRRGSRGERERERERERARREHVWLWHNIYFAGF
jgi:hypothetical protein